MTAATKSILCYGDSNTWGFDPATTGRYDPEDRWTGVLRRALGEKYHVIEEGLNGRTTVWDDPLLPGRNGRDYLGPCLDSHRPLDYVVLFLGVNDLKKRFSVSAQEIARGIGLLISMIGASRVGREGRSPGILVIAPPLLGKLTSYAEEFGGSLETSGKLPSYIRQAALGNGCGFLDASELISTSDLDGLHFDVSAHRTLGHAVERCIRVMAERD